MSGHRAAAWKVPREWEGEACVIIGGGPSVTAPIAQTAAAAGARVIAINNSYLLAPQADILYFCDERWWGWHEKRPEFQAFIHRAERGEARIVTLDNFHMKSRLPFLHCVRNAGRAGLERSPDAVRNGANSGYQCINLAFHLGCKHLILLGYDMQPQGGKTHWHADHKIATPPSVFGSLMLPFYNELARELEKEGVMVDNCSENSALKVFPITPLEKALSNAHINRRTVCAAACADSDT